MTAPLLFSIPKQRAAPRRGCEDRAEKAVGVMGTDEAGEFEAEEQKQQEQQSVSWP